MKTGPSRSRRLLYIAGFGTLLLIFALALPDPLFDSPYSPVLYGRKGELLGARVARDGQWRFPPGARINEKFAEALLEYEDRRFRYHPGVDPAALCRALIQNIRAGGVVSGGSTLTMQTIRLSRQDSRREAGLPFRRTLLEKAVEAVLALRLEIALSKDEILALYAAHAPFGGNVVGLEAASWRWFGRPADDLSWAEAAVLAVLPNSPSLVHPGRNRELLREKRDALLERLANRGRIDRETLELARAEALPAEPLPLPQLAPHLLSRIIAERENSDRDDSSRIDTTLDGPMQEQADRIMRRWAGRFAANGIMNGACLVMDTGSGEVRVYVGNVQSPEAADVDIINSSRSSGSILKPFLFAAMLDSGDILPSSLVSDIPTRVGSYSPENITRNYLGAVPAGAALARSLNIPAVRSLRRYGVSRFARLLRTLGVTTLFRADDEYGLPLILGGAEVTLWNMAGLYGGLARTSLLPFSGESQFFPPRYYPRVPPETAEVAGRGAGGPENGPAKAAAIVPEARPFSPGAAWLTLEALTFAVRPGEEAAWQDYASSRRIAWKTGTSFGFRDAWAIGVTPRWTIAVWIGNATGEGRPELRSAVTASPVLFELFSAFDAGEWFPKPTTELRTVEVCAASGFPAGIDCENLTAAEAPRRSPASSPCPYCRTVTLNEAADRQVLVEAGSSGPVIQRKWFVLPPAEEWYYRRWNLDYRPLPPNEEPLTANFRRPASLPLALFNPEENSRIYVPIELDGSPGRIIFMAAHRESGERIHWHLDETYLGYTEVFHEMEGRPSPGSHTLTLVDMAGNTITRRFDVPDRAEDR